MLSSRIFKTIYYLTILHHEITAKVGSFTNKRFISIFLLFANFHFIEKSVINNIRNNGLFVFCAIQKVYKKEVDFVLFIINSFFKYNFILP